MSDHDPRAEPDYPAGEDRPNWEQLIDDMAATADQYREEGWEALEVHPGDISAFPGESGRAGFELLAPDNEFDPVADAFDATSGFEESEVFRAVEAGMVYVLIVLAAPDIETVVLLPAYYSHGNDRAFVEYLEANESVPVHVRPLDQRRVLTFSHADPSLFLPPDS